MLKIVRRSASLGIAAVLIAALTGPAGSTTSTPSSPGDAAAPLPHRIDRRRGRRADRPRHGAGHPDPPSRPRRSRAGGPDHRRVGPHRSRRATPPTSRCMRSTSPQSPVGSPPTASQRCGPTSRARARPGSAISRRTPAAAVTVDDYLTMNAELPRRSSRRARRRRPTRLGVSSATAKVGLFAVLLAASRARRGRRVPTVQAIAGLEPQAAGGSSTWTHGPGDRGRCSTVKRPRNMSAADGAALLDELAAAVAAVRAGSPLPNDLPAPLAGLFPSTAPTYLRTDDAIHPPTVAAQLPAGMPVLLSCSDADIQVAARVRRRRATSPPPRPCQGRWWTLSHLTDMAHTLKVDPSGTAAHYGDDLPFFVAAAPGHQHVDAAVGVTVGSVTGRGGYWGVAVAEDDLLRRRVEPRRRDRRPAQRAGSSTVIMPMNSWPRTTGILRTALARSKCEHAVHVGADVDGDHRSGHHCVDVGVEKAGHGPSPAGRGPGRSRSRSGHPARRRPGRRHRRPP